MAVSGWRPWRWRVIGGSAGTLIASIGWLCPKLVAGSAAEHAIVHSPNAPWFCLGDCWGQCCIGIARWCWCGAAGAGAMPNGMSTTAMSTNNLQTVAMRTF